MKLLVPILCLLAFGAATPVSQRQMLLTVEISTREQLDNLTQIAETDLELDFWTHPKLNGFTDVMVPAQRFHQLHYEWSRAGMTVHVKEQDVQELIQRVAARNIELAKQPYSSQETTLNHNFYRSYQDFVDGFQALYDRFGEEFIRFDRSGSTPSRPKSLENRIIHVVEVGKRTTPDTPVIMIEVLIHAREWITGAANFYMVDWLLTNYNSNDDAAYVLDNYLLVIVPVANPDGYEYSMKTQRMWRKNRRHNSGSCYGVDLNRNFCHKWQSMGMCQSDSYPGRRCESEPETQALVAIFHHYRSNMVMFFGVHSYSQLVLMPWTWQMTSTPVDTMHRNMAELMAKAMEGIDNRRHVATTLYSFLNYVAYGSSADWALYTRRSQAGGEKFLSLAYELRPQAGLGFQGFVLDATHIVPTGKEFLVSIVAAARNYSAVTRAE